MLASHAMSASTNPSPRMAFRSIIPAAWGESQIPWNLIMRVSYSAADLFCRGQKNW